MWDAICLTSFHEEKKHPKTFVFRSDNPPPLLRNFGTVSLRVRVFYLVGGPEPAVDELGEELWLVAAVEVALPAGGPEELDPGVDEAPHPVVLLLALEGHQVHATLPGERAWLRRNQQQHNNSITNNNTTITV